MMNYYDRNGDPIDMATWGRLFGDRDYQVVAQTNMIDARTGNNQDVLISTVWLGMNHNWGTGPPLIFETMIFGLEELEDWQVRSPTEDHAQVVHSEAIMEVALVVGGRHIATTEATIAPPRQHVLEEDIPDVE